LQQDRRIPTRPITFGFEKPILAVATAVATLATAPFGRSLAGGRGARPHGLAAPRLDAAPRRTNRKVSLLGEDAKLCRVELRSLFQAIALLAILWDDSAFVEPSE